MGYVWQFLEIDAMRFINEKESTVLCLLAIQPNLKNKVFKFLQGKESLLIAKELSGIDTGDESAREAAQTIFQTWK